MVHPSPRLALSVDFAILKTNPLEFRLEDRRFFAIFSRSKLALSMLRIDPVGVFSTPSFRLLSMQEVPAMKLRTIFSAAALTALFALAPVIAHAEHGDGDWDDHHAWHDARWWHDNHPGWVWHHHPDWVERHSDWRATDGDWDDHHVWRDRGWWYENHPNWVREHHHDWVRWHDDD